MNRVFAISFDGRQEAEKQDPNLYLREAATFNAIKRRLDGVTQKAMMETLRRMERHGLLARRMTLVRQ